MLLIESEIPASNASETLGVTAPRIWRVFDYWLSRALKSDSLSNIRKVGVDETSRRKGTDMPKGHKYTVLKSPKNLSKANLEILDQLRIRYPRLGQTYTLRQLFMDVYSINDSIIVKSDLAFWCDLAIESQITQLVEFANMIKSR